MKQRFFPAELQSQLNIAELGIECRYSEEKKVAIFYSGKSSKPNFYVRFLSVENMMGRINQWIEAVKKRAADVAERRKADKEVKAETFYKTGDVVVNSWGYEQTNVEFYQVVAVKNKTIQVEQIGSQQVEVTSWCSDTCNPSIDKFLANGDRYSLRVKAGGRLSNPESYHYFHKWEGRPQYRSWGY